MVRFSLSKVVGFNVEIFFLISVHKFSMGLRSGKFSGHLSTLTWCGGVFLVKAKVVFTSCHKDKQYKRPRWSFTEFHEHSRMHNVPTRLCTMSQGQISHELVSNQKCESAQIARKFS